MSAYELTQIIKMWERADLTTEQAIGQILLHVQGLSQRVGTLEKRLEKPRQKRANKPKRP